MDNLSNIGTIKEILHRHGFAFSKSLGQNFLINPSVCPRIAEEGNAKKGFGIIEIGTGIGVLTAELAKRADKVVAVEIDTRLQPVLQETLAEFSNVKVIYEDVLKVDLRELIEQEFAGLEVAVCANLPYYITSPVIMRLLEEKLPFKKIIVMVQKEAGDRLCAKVGTRESGAVTVAVNYYAKARKLFDVSRGSFFPSPKVDSCVIELDLTQKGDYPVIDEKLFFQTVKAAFAQRRKTVLNALSSGMGIEKSKIAQAVKNAGVSENARAEALTMEQLVNLSNEIFKVKD